MTLYAIHYAWIDGHHAKAPVGIWAEGGVCYYPPQFESLRSDGTQARDESQNKPWAAWVQMRSEDGSTYGASWRAVESDQPMQQVLDGIQAKFFSVPHPVLSFVSSVPPANTTTDGTEAIDSEAEEPEDAPPPPPPFPAPRFVAAQAWWIASEICRRNSALRILETWPMGGFYHGLEVGEPDRARFVFMNYVGRIHLNDGGDEHPAVTWPETFAAQSPHDVVKSIERVMRWGDSSADATTPRSLTYRVLAACLWRRINDRVPWTVEAGLWSGGADPEWGAAADLGAFLTDFDGAPGVIDADEDALLRVWVVARNGMRAVLLSDRGRLYRRGQPPVDLMPEYRKRHVLDDVTALVLEEAAKSG